MNLSELIKTVGDENVQIQNLKSSFLRASAGKKGGEITFATSREKAQQLLNSIALQETPEMTALVVWIPTSLIQSPENKATKSSPEPTNK